jgi:hypothetical protein
VRRTNGSCIVYVIRFATEFQILVRVCESKLSTRDSIPASHTAASPIRPLNDRVQSAAEEQMLLTRSIHLSLAENRPATTSALIDDR